MPQWGKHKLISNTWAVPLVAGPMWIKPGTPLPPAVPIIDMQFIGPPGTPDLSPEDIQKIFARFVGKPYVDWVTWSPDPQDLQ